MTILGPDSTVPVLGCSPSPDEPMSSISPVRRRRIVVLPRRGACTKENDFDEPHLQGLMFG